MLYFYYFVLTKLTYMFWIYNKLMKVKWIILFRGAK